MTGCEPLCPSSSVAVEYLNSFRKTTNHSIDDSLVARGVGRANVGSLPYHILAARTDTNSGHPRWGEHANVVLGHEPIAVTTLRHEGESLAT